MKRRTSRPSNFDTCELGACRNEAEHEITLKSKQTMRTLLLCQECLPHYLNANAGKDIWTKPLEKKGLTYELQEQAQH